MTDEADLSAATASEYFAAMVDSYDSLIRRAVPRYEEMTQRLVEYLPPNAMNVLELGCGTGNLSLRLAARLPNARFTFVDAADEMVELTRERIATASPSTAGHARFVVERFENLELPDSSHDLIVSSISLHHVRNKEALFRALYGALADHGHFCFADQMRAAPALNHERNWQAWLAFCREPGNCTAEEIESLLAHAAAHDHYETAAEQLQMLTRAGFSDVDCVWRNGMWGIITAMRTLST